MTNKEAIEVIKSNYPPEHYTMLRQALDLAIIALQSEDRMPNLKGRGTIKTGGF
jgi:hypothetical protein